MPQVTYPVQNPLIPAVAGVTGAFTGINQGNEIREKIRQFNATLAEQKRQTNLQVTMERQKQEGDLLNQEKSRITETSGKQAEIRSSENMQQTGINAKDIEQTKQNIWQTGESNADRRLDWKKNVEDNASRRYDTRKNFEIGNAQLAQRRNELNNQDERLNQTGNIIAEIKAVTGKDVKELTPDELTPWIRKLTISRVSPERVSGNADIPQATGEELHKGDIQSVADILGYDNAVEQHRGQIKQLYEDKSQLDLQYTENIKGSGRSGSNEEVGGVSVSHFFTGNGAVLNPDTGLPEIDYGRVSVVAGPEGSLALQNCERVRIKALLDTINLSNQNAPQNAYNLVWQDADRDTQRIISNLNVDKYTKESLMDYYEKALVNTIYPGGSVPPPTETGIDPNTGREGVIGGRASVNYNGEPVNANEAGQ